MSFAAWVASSAKPESVHTQQGASGNHATREPNPDAGPSLHPHDHTCLPMNTCGKFTTVPDSILPRRRRSRSSTFDSSTKSTLLLMVKTAKFDHGCVCACRRPPTETSNYQRRYQALPVPAAANTTYPTYTTGTNDHHRCDTPYRRLRRGCTTSSTSRTAPGSYRRSGQRPSTVGASAATTHALQCVHRLATSEDSGHPAARCRRR